MVPRAGGYGRRRGPGHVAPGRRRDELPPGRGRYRENLRSLRALQGQNFPSVTIEDS